MQTSQKDGSTTENGVHGAEEAASESATKSGDCCTTKTTLFPFRMDPELLSEALARILKVMADDLANVNQHF